MIDQNDWVRNIGKGEPAAYKVLFDTFYASLTGFIMNYVYGRQAAEDIAQDVFFDLWTRRLSFESEISLKTYCYRSARSRCLDLLKHRKVRQMSASYIASTGEIDDFLDHILEEEIFSVLKKAIEKLPDDTRRVYELTLLGHDNRQIAEIMQTTVDSVKSRKKRGKDILQEKLKNTFSLIISLL